MYAGIQYKTNPGGVDRIFWAAPLKQKGASEVSYDIIFMSQGALWERFLYSDESFTGERTIDPNSVVEIKQIDKTKGDTEISAGKLVF